MNSNIRIAFFRQWLNWLWLRPENALMWTFRAEAYKAALETCKPSRVIDISCGDGVFSFITAGGELAEVTDMFQSLDTSKRRLGNFDAFDNYDDSYSLEIIKRPTYNFSIGTDWKSNLLKKAIVLNFYEKVIQHDNNNILQLADNSFDFVFSNSTYWVRNYVQHIKDLARICTPKGHVVLELKTPDILKYSNKTFLPKEFGKKSSSILDAGRLSTWNSLKTLEEYISILKDSGLKIIDITPLYGPIIGEIWDVGLRPFFNPLTKLANSVDPIIRLEVKREFISICEDLLTEYIINHQAQKEHCFEWCVIAEKC